MKEFRSLTAKQVEHLSNSVFVRYNFEGEFYMLHDFSGNTFTDISEAQEFLRRYMNDIYWEVSTLESAVDGHGMRDNV